MTDLERARDDLLYGVGFAVAATLRERGEPNAANTISERAQALKEASAKQHDADRNEIRRAVRKPDCEEKAEEV